MDSETSELIVNNLGLVKKIAMDFVGLGVSLQDLVSEGNKGLYEGARRFDSSRKVKFSTYATYWIKQAIRKALTEQRTTIKIPIGSQKQIKLIRAKETELTHKNGEKPTDEILAKATELSIRTIKRLRNASTQVNYLNPTDDGSVDEEKTMQTTEISESPLQNIIHFEEIKQLLTLIETLPEREKTVIQLRFGLCDNPAQTFKAISEKLNISSERARQIHNQAIKRIQKQMLDGKK